MQLIFMGGFLRLAFGHAQKLGYPLPWLVRPCTSQGMSLRTANSLLLRTSSIHAASECAFVSMLERQFLAEQRHRFYVEPHGGVFGKIAAHLLTSKAAATLPQQ